MSQELEKSPLQLAIAEAQNREPVPLLVRRQALARFRDQCAHFAQLYPNLWHLHAEGPADLGILEGDLPYFLAEYNGQWCPARGAPVNVPIDQKILYWCGGGFKSKGVEHVELLLGDLDTIRRGKEALHNVTEGVRHAIDGLPKEMWDDLLQCDSRDHMPGDWLTVVHRLAWQKRPGSPLSATRMSWTIGADLRVTNFGIVALSNGFEFPYDEGDAQRVLSVWHQEGEQEKIDAVARRIGWPPRHFISPLPLDVFSALATSIDMLLDALGRHHAPAPSPDVPTRRPSEATPQKCFLKDGKVWLLRYAGKRGCFPNLDGFRYLHTLLSAAGTEIAALELYSGESLLEYSNNMGYLQIDGRTRQEVEAALQDGLLSRDQRKHAEDYLRKALRLGGRHREFSSDSESARSTVRQRIGSAITMIREELPELADHLQAAVRTGAKCVYRPPDPVPVWEL